MSISNDVTKLINSIIQDATGVKESDFTEEIGSIGFDYRDFERALIDQVIERYRYRFKNISSREMREIVEEAIQLSPRMQLYEVAGSVSVALRLLASLPGDPTKDGDPG